MYSTCHVCFITWLLVPVCVMQNLERRQSVTLFPPGYREEEEEEGGVVKEEGVHNWYFN